MRPIRNVLVATVIGAMCSLGQTAFAQSADSGVAASTSSASPNVGKTRAEVRAELVQAEAQGLLPITKNEYPPSAQEIAHNRAQYQTQHIDNRVASLTTVKAPTD